MNNVTTFPTRYRRRLSDKILIAFHQSCDQNDVETARSLLDVLDFMVQRPRASSEDGERRINEILVAAHERLWHVQHPQMNW
jgi:hypothetical protein